MKKNWKRYLRILFLVCMLLCGMAFPVFAKEGGSLPVGYVLEDKLYVFLEAEEEEEVTLGLNGNFNLVKPETLKPFKDSGQYVHYFLLLDCSGSMKKYMPQEKLEELARGLLENTQAKTRVSLLSLGDTFKQGAEDMTVESAVLQALKEVSFQESKTNLYDGVDSALDHVKEKDRRDGELYYIILITDGEPDGEAEKATFDQVEERIGDAKDIIFATVGLGEEDKEHISFGEDIDGQDISAAASEIARMVNGMYTVCFELKNQPVGEDLRITLISSKKKSWEIEGVPIVMGKKPESEAEGEGEEAAQEGGAGEEQDEKADREEKRPEVGDSQEKGLPEKAEGEEESFDQQPEDPGNPEQKQSWLMQYIIFLLGGIAVLCVLALIWKKKRKNPESEGIQNRAGEEKGMTLCVEVIAGRCLTRKRNFSLSHDILIGCGRGCDIIWEEEDVEEQNSKIFLRDGVVYIKDLDSRYGTAINGMRIYAQNRLRDGDVVSIGRVQFRILL